MTDISFELSGLDRIERRLEDLRDDWDDSPRYLVGSAVEYAVYLEYGSSKMDPKPFFRPALAEARADLEGFIADNTRKRAEEIDTARELVRTIALALERRVKEIITEKGLIDTGTLRASVLAVPGTDFGQLPAADDLDYDEEGNPIDARVSAGAEVTV